MGRGKAVVDEVGNCTGKVCLFHKERNAAHPYLEPCEMLDWAAPSRSAPQKTALTWGSGSARGGCAVIPSRFGGTEVRKAGTTARICSRLLEAASCLAPVSHLLCSKSCKSDC